MQLLENFVKKKKSYLDPSNINESINFRDKKTLSEFSILFPKLAEKIKKFMARRDYKNAIKVAKKSPEMAKNIKNLNKASTEAEKAFEKQFGIKINLSKSQLSDFY